MDAQHIYDVVSTWWESKKFNHINGLIGKLGPGEVFLVGGAIRDRLQNRDPKDIDLIYTGHPDILKNVIRTLYPGEYKVNSLGGYRLWLDDMWVDVWAVPSVKDYLDYMLWSVDAIVCDISGRSLIKCSAFNDCWDQGVIYTNMNTQLYEDMKSRPDLAVRGLYLADKLGFNMGVLGFGKIADVLEQHNIDPNKALVQYKSVIQNSLDRQLKADYFAKKPPQPRVFTTIAAPDWDL
jgi:hypothetical protein